MMYPAPASDLQLTAEISNPLGLSTLAHYIPYYHIKGRARSSAFSYPSVGDAKDKAVIAV